MLIFLLAAAAIVQATGPTPIPSDDALAILPGEWEIVDGATGKVQQACSMAQHFEVSPDRSSIVLTERGVKDWSARYRVIHAEPKRLLAILEGEQRLTAAGDPVLWWAYFDGNDRFRWRRYDWQATEATTAEWRRCAAEAAGAR